MIKLVQAGEGSIFPYRNGYAAYVWVTTPEGKRTRKWAYGKTREETHEKWLKLHDAAGKGPVVTKSPTLAEYLGRWLVNVVEPELAPSTAANYEMFVRLYIVTTLGRKRLDKLTVANVRACIHPRVVMQILRHSQIAVTMDIYSEVSSAATRKALRKLGDQLG